MNSIEIRDCTKEFQGFKLDKISFKVPKGAIVGLIGANGAGKSTTINCIMNALAYDEGEIKVLNINNQDKAFLNCKQDIGIVLDEAFFPDILTLNDVEKILKYTYKNWDSKLFYNYIEQFGLPKNKALKNFSTGMKRKVSILSALSHHPKLLILDEPTSGLDPMVREEVLEMLNEYTRDEENAILFSSHIVSDLEKICDYIVFINDGKIVLFEEKDVLLEQYGLLKVKESELVDLDQKAIVSKKLTTYGYDTLVIKALVPKVFKMEMTTLEDIIIFISKEEQQ